MSEIRSQATPARDSGLTDALRDAVGDNYDHGRNSAALLWHEDGIRDAIDWAGAARDLEREGWSKPRTVNSAADLDALPVNSVVVDASDTPRTKRYGDSHMGAGWTNAGRSPLSSRELADGRPMRVLFTPGDAG